MRPRWIIGVPWWLALMVWLMWFAFTILLTFAGLLVMIAGGVVWLIGAAIEPRSSDTGRAWKASGAGLAGVTMRAVDRLNGHR